MDGRVNSDYSGETWVQTSGEAGLKSAFVKTKERGFPPPKEGEGRVSAEGPRRKKGSDCGKKGMGLNAKQGKTDKRSNQSKKALRIPNDFVGISPSKRSNFYDRRGKLGGG